MSVPRRRGLCASLLRLTAVCGVLLAPCVRAAVMGIDLGSEYMKVSLVKPGSMMDIVTNVHSKRKTETIVSFYQGERSYGADAYVLLSKKPEVTYARLRTLLGRKREHPAVSLLEQAYFPNKVAYNESRGGLTVDELFTPEELVAMVLSHAKDITKAYGGAPVHDAVLIIPSYFTQAERQALLDAAEIADVKTLSLMDENTAAALLYGVDNVYDKPTYIMFYNMGASSLQVSLVEYTSFTVGEKRVGTLEVKAKAWDEHLGGFHFDLRLAELLADRFNHKWATKGGKGQDVRQHPKAMAKLRAQAKKVKEVLSANSFIPVNVEGVHNDMDLSTQVTRQEFETLCADLFDRALEPVDRVLQQANISLADVTAVEVVGGGIRVPKLQTKLRKYLQKGSKGLDFSMRLNGDEAMAQGAAFMAANISTRFRVRPVGVTDTLPWAVGVRMEEAPPEKEKGGPLGGLFKGWGRKKDGESASETPTDSPAPSSFWTKRATVFGPNHRLKANRTIAFNATKDVVLNLTYESALPDGAQSTIAVYEIRGIDTLCKEVGSKAAGAPRVFLTFELDSSGMVKLVKAEAVSKEVASQTATTATDAQQSTATDEETTVRDGEGESSDDNKAASDDSSPASSSSSSSSEGETEDEGVSKKDVDPVTAANDSTADDGSSSSEGEAEEEGMSKKDVDPVTAANDSTASAEKTPAAAANTTTVPPAPKPKTHKKKLSVSVHYTGMDLKPMTEVEKSHSRAKLDKLRREDQIRVEKAEARNALEGYLYDVQNKMSDIEELVAQVSTEEQRSAVLSLVSETEEWMYEDGRDVAAQVYRDKHHEVKKAAGPIFTRVAEGPGEGLREKAVAAAKKEIADIRALVKKWETTMPWLTEEERKSVTDEADRVEAWLKGKEDEQAKKEAHDEPAFLAKEVSPQLKRVKETVRRLGRKPRPPPPKPKPSNKTTDGNATDNNSSTTTVNDAAGESGGVNERENMQNGGETGVDGDVDGESVDEGMGGNGGAEGEDLDSEAAREEL